MPGLIDAHLHLCVWQRNESEAIHIIRTTIDAEKLLQTGFTTVRCYGAKETLHIKRAIEEEIIRGPRIMASRTALSSSVYSISSIAREVNDLFFIYFLISSYNIKLALNRIVFTLHNIILNVAKL